MSLLKNEHQEIRIFRKNFLWAKKGLNASGQPEGIHGQPEEEFDPWERMPDDLLKES